MCDSGVTLAVGLYWLQLQFQCRPPAIISVSFLDREGEQEDTCLTNGNLFCIAAVQLQVFCKDSCVLSHIYDLTILSAVQVLGATKQGRLKNPNTHSCFVYFACRAQYLISVLFHKSKGKEGAARLVPCHCSGWLGGEVTPSQ